MNDPVTFLDRCPKCGTEVEYGFGLAGGGYGTYAYCPNAECFDGYFAKQQCDDDE